VPSSIAGHRRIRAELPSVKAGEQHASFLLSSATLDRPASSLRRAGRHGEPSHHHHRSGRRSRHHIPGATELLIAGHFFLVVASFVYPKLLPDVPESTAAECCRHLPDAYIDEPPPSFLPRRFATHHVASRRHRARWPLPLGCRGPLGVLCAQATDTVPLGRTLKSAHDL
jgi:hypothetical protein